MLIYTSQGRASENFCRLRPLFPKRSHEPEVKVSEVDVRNGNSLPDAGLHISMSVPLSSRLTTASRPFPAASLVILRLYVGDLLSLSGTLHGSCAICQA